MRFIVSHPITCDTRRAQKLARAIHMMQLWLSLVLGECTLQLYCLLWYKTALMRLSQQTVPLA